MEGNRAKEAERTGKCCSTYVRGLSRVDMTLGYVFSFRSQPVREHKDAHLNRCCSSIPRLQQGIHGCSLDIVCFVNIFGSTHREIVHISCVYCLHVIVYACIHIFRMKQQRYPITWFGWMYFHPSFSFLPSPPLFL